MRDRVAPGGELDGGRLDDYIGPVGRLIRSGRVELFAG